MIIVTHPPFQPQPGKKLQRLGYHGNLRYIIESGRWMAQTKQIFMQPLENKEVKVDDFGSRSMSSIDA